MNYINIILIFSTFFILNRQSEQRLDHLVTINNQTYSDNSKIAVLPYDSTLTWIFKNVTPSDLNENELVKIETILRACIDNFNIEQKQELKKLNLEYPDAEFKKSEHLIKLRKYKRQYIPIINENGEKEVWVNCFCQTNGDRWKKEFVMVLDGGNCYFNLKINLNSGDCYDIMVNGVA